MYVYMHLRNKIVLNINMYGYVAIINYRYRNVFF